MRYCQVKKHHRGAACFAFVYNADMTPPPAPALYKRHRYPTEIIAHAVWLYFRFPLSYRDVEELLAARGIPVTYETIRQWCLKFGVL